VEEDDFEDAEDEEHGEFDRGEEIKGFVSKKYKDSVESSNQMAMKQSELLSARSSIGGLQDSHNKLRDTVFSYQDEELDDYDTNR
jgi:hypothetical protein